jgi:hypothetical protein
MSTATLETSRSNAFLQAITQNPERALAAFLVLHAVLWTFVPYFVCRNLPFDLYEGIAYGQDWQLGYWKHPPLPWLLIDLTRRVFGAHFWAFYLLGQAAVALCFWAVWRLGREILSPLAAFAAVVMLDGNFAFTIYASEFNHNIAQLPLFALAAWSLYRAFVGQRLIDWALVGLWFALAFYAKYEAVILLAPALAFSVIDGRARRSWRGAGPYVAAAVCAVLFAPHAIWALNNNLGPISFFNSRADPVPSVFALLKASGMFTANALLLILPAAILFGMTWGSPRWITTPAPPPATSREAFTRRYLGFLTFGPLAVSLAAQLILARKFPDIWVMQFFCFISLFLVARWQPKLDQAALWSLLTGWCVVTIVFVLVQVAAQVFLVAPSSLIPTQFPGAQFSAMVRQAWQSEMGDTPLDYIIAEPWEAGNVILFAEKPPRMFAEDEQPGPRADLPEVLRHGGIILWPATTGRGAAPPPSDFAPWMVQFPEAERREPFVLQQKTLRGEIFWTIRWALLRPAK